MSAPSPRTPPDVEVVVPVLNEAGGLEASVGKLHAFVSRRCDFSFRIPIADNASTDGTLEIAHRLSAELPEVEVIREDLRGIARLGRAASGRQVTGRPPRLIGGPRSHPRRTPAARRRHRADGRLHRARHVGRPSH